VVLEAKRNIRGGHGEASRLARDPKRQPSRRLINDFLPAEGNCGGSRSSTARPDQRDTNADASRRLLVMVARDTGAVLAYLRSEVVSTISSMGRNGRHGGALRA